MPRVVTPGEFEIADRRVIKRGRFTSRRILPSRPARYYLAIAAGAAVSSLKL